MTSQKNTPETFPEWTQEYYDYPSFCARVPAPPLTFERWSQLNVSPFPAQAYVATLAKQILRQQERAAGELSVATSKLPLSRYVLSRIAWEGTRNEHCAVATC
jgi:hypothetical protein